jgi:hypothetical protein
MTTANRQAHGTYQIKSSWVLMHSTRAQTIVDAVGRRVQVVGLMMTD